MFIAPHHRVRRMTVADLDECKMQAEHAFRKALPYMDLQGMYDVCVENVDNMNVLLIRTDHAFGCANIDMTHFEPRPWVHEQWVFGPVWEVIALIREMMLWRDRIGAFRFTIGSLTEHDFAVIARRLGPHTKVQSYNFDAEEGL
jgi:hypothetical protein